MFILDRNAADDHALCGRYKRSIVPIIAVHAASGATSNLNGTAVYIPLACVFLAKVGGYDALLTPLRFVLLGFVSAIASFGVAGVPTLGW